MEFESETPRGAARRLKIRPKLVFYKLYLSPAVALIGVITVATEAYYLNEIVFLTLFF